MTVGLSEISVIWWQLQATHSLCVRTRWRCCSVRCHTSTLAFALGFGLWALAPRFWILNFWKSVIVSEKWWAICLGPFVQPLLDCLLKTHQMPCTPHPPVPSYVCVYMSCVYSFNFINELSKTIDVGSGVNKKNSKIQEITRNNSRPSRLGSCQTIRVCVHVTLLAWPRQWMVHVKRQWLSWLNDAIWNTTVLRAKVRNATFLRAHLRRSYRW